MGDFSCKKIFDPSICVNFESEKIHKGTKTKFDLMEYYITAWCQKILNYKPEYDYQKYNGVIFIDCMSNKGFYQDKENNDIVYGTSKRAFDKLSSCCKEFPEHRFELFFNDYNPQKYDCLNCLLKSQESTQDNLTYSTYNYDVNVFLSEVGLEILNKAKKNQYHILLFYDPFEIMFDWDILEPYVKSNGIDIIFTHFFQNDTLRSLPTNLKEVAKAKYEKAYATDFDLLIREYNQLTPLERVEYFRDKFNQQLNKYANKEIAYFPIVNEKYSPLYDIVFFSHSIKAKELFKNSMHKAIVDLLKPETKAIIEEQTNQTMISLFPISHTDSYIESRQSGVSEVEYFYSKIEHAKIIRNQYKGKTVLKSDYDKFLVNHDYLPTNTKKPIKDVLTSNGWLEIHKDGGKEKAYTFK